jgi:hypothetical protein
VADFANPLTIALSHKERGDVDIVYPSWGEGLSIY